jgi:hypothetical protein
MIEILCGRCMQVREDNHQCAKDAPEFSLPEEYVEIKGAALTTTTRKPKEDPETWADMDMEAMRVELNKMRNALKEAQTRALLLELRLQPQNQLGFQPINAPSFNTATTAAMPLVYVTGGTNAAGTSFMFWNSLGNCNNVFQNK